MLEIAQVMLSDFYKYLEKFLTLQPPNGYMLRNQEVKDEFENFLFNSKLLSDTSIFIKSCHEIYSSLVKQVEDLLIPKNSFIKLMQYLSRLRFNMSYLLHTMKNCIKNHKNDIIKYNGVLELNKVFHIEPETFLIDDRDRREENIKKHKHHFETFNFHKFLRGLYIKMKKNLDKDANNNFNLLTEERIKASRLKYILDK
jgi:hypothetical protein